MGGFESGFGFLGGEGGEGVLTPVPAGRSPAGVVVGLGRKPAGPAARSSPGRALAVGPGAAGLDRKLVGRRAAAAVVGPGRSFAGRRAVVLGAGLGLGRRAAGRIGRTWLFVVDGDKGWWLRVSKSLGC